MNKQFAKKLINKTKQDYNSIAEHFASTRKKAIWPDILDSLKIMEPKKGGKVLDAGCGNGRLYSLLSKDYDLTYTGIDLSDELIRIAKKNNPEGKFLVGDLTDLPFCDKTFDYVVSVAVLYHIPSKELREKAIQELYRVTKSGGQAYLSVWYFWNKWSFVKEIFESYASTLWRRFIILFSTSSNDNLEFGDFYIPWKTPQGEIVTERYAHAWTIFGLKIALEKAGFRKVRLIKAENDKKLNLNFICKKS